MAQDLNISGTVLDGSGDPVVGASVVVKGTTNGVTTGINGDYNIAAPPDAALTFSFLGLETKEEAVDGRGRIDVVMSAGEQAIEEVVVIGYGTMKKKDLTGSIAQVRPDRLADENPKTVQDVLRGMPGLRVGFTADAKGGGSMMIRGRNSLGTGSSPLLILDGMQFYGELSEINPDDIEQIDILKDASAAAVYGSKAANGVIIIMTKKGAKGKPQVSVTASVGITQRSYYREVYSPAEYLQVLEDYNKSTTLGINPATGMYEYYQSGANNGKYGYYERPTAANLAKYGITLDQWRALGTQPTNLSADEVWATRNDLRNPMRDNFLAGKTYDWWNSTFQLGFNQDYNASVSGASDKMNYYFSMGYLSNEGAVVGDEYNSVRSNLKLNGKVTSWLEVGANVNFQDRSNSPLTISTGTLNRMNPYAMRWDENGREYSKPSNVGGSGASIYNGNQFYDNQFLEREQGFTLFNTILNAKITLPFGITYSFNASPRYEFYYNRYFMSTLNTEVNPTGRGADRTQRKRFDWSLNNNLTWDKTFADKHHVILTLVQEAEERKKWEDAINLRNLSPSDALGFHSPGSTADKELSDFNVSDDHSTADALMARAFYSFDDKYMLTATIRRDGYSAFGTADAGPYSWFPSVSVGYAFVNEPFFQWRNIMSSGKLRVSYGKNGNRDIGQYATLSDLTAGGGMGYLVDGVLDERKTLIISKLANPNLQWEKTQAWNFGLDYGFLNDRITGSFDFYRKATHDMIMSQSLPSITGFTSIMTNLGEVRNTGFELSINSMNLRTGLLEWRTQFGISYNKSEITHLYYTTEDVHEGRWTGHGAVVGAAETNDVANNWFIGQPIDVIWNYRVTGIWQQNEAEEAAKYGQRPGDPKVANIYTADDEILPDGSRRPVYNNNDKEFLGNSVAPWQWSMRNEFTLWKSLSVSFNIYSYMGWRSVNSDYLNNFNEGGAITNGQLNLWKTPEYWTPDNASGKYARIGATGPAGALTAGRLYNRSFIRFENVSVSYTLPQRWTKLALIERAKIYGTIRNLGVWTMDRDWMYGDPETGGFASRIYTMGLSLTF
jgi:TonB-linked SusC/RagA family outer membrane protein